MNMGSVGTPRNTGRQAWSLPYTPLEEGRTPRSVAVRDGLHAGAAQWAFVNDTPRRASRSMLGVRACS